MRSDIKIKISIEIIEMASLISAVEYKKKTGLKTKKEGIYFAKKYNVKTNLKIKDKTKRYNTFLKTLKNEIAKRDSELINKRVISKNVVDFVLGKIDKIHITEDSLIRSVKNTIDGRDYTRRASSSIDNEFIYNLLKNINQKQGKNLMIEIKYIEYGDNGAEKERKKYYVVNQLFLDNIKEKDGEEEFYTGFGVIQLITSIKVYYKNKTNKNKKLEGGFFKYHLKSEKSSDKLIEVLEKYQIYTENNNAELKANNEDNCLIHALKLSDIDDKILNKLKCKCKSSVIPMVAIKEFALENNLIINVKTHNKSYKHGNTGQIINLCLIEDHYFINEKVNITKYSINNYETVKDMDQWWNINKVSIVGDKKYYKRDKEASNDSFNLVKLLHENDFFKEITLDNKSITLINYNKINTSKIELDNEYDIYDEITCRKEKDITKILEEVKKDVRLKKLYKTIGGKPKDIIIAFDFETTTDTETHKPFLVSTNIYDGDKKIMKNIITLTGEDCSLSLLESINTIIVKYLDNLGLDILNNKEDKSFKRKIINQLFNFTMFAHNITYDIQFLMKHVSYYNPVIRSGNKICGGSFYFRGIGYNLKDTYAIIPYKLADFGKIFNLKIEKEIMPYELYNEENVKKGLCRISEAIKYIKNESDIEKFKENVKNFSVDNKYFNHIAYARYYCERDIDVMMEGYFTFRKWVLEELQIDINSFLTISSISDEFFKKNKCYDECYKLDGIAREYIQRTVVGGRCMSRKNKKYILKKKLNDFDGVSLYPSAMKRLSEIGGYLKGTPKEISEKSKNMNFLSKQDGYFIRIMISKIRVSRNFPLLSKINKKGVRIFSNEIDEEEENNIYYMNKISMEDLMEFQGVKEKDFIILDGYYFDEGRNNKIGKIISKVFELRLKYKALKNPIQELYKLIMNSAYGKTIMKEVNTTTKYLDSKQALDNEISLNYNHILEYEKLYDCNKYIMKKQKAINQHKNACHIGSEILSMSKRIMNEVMCLAEDNDIEIYYQDTDSMHIMNDEIEKLALLFKNKYDRELIGKKMGQFHCDFAPLIKDGIISDASHSTKTIILGKKSYLDIVKHYNGEYSTHFRMKGIPSEIVKGHADKKYNGDIYELYKRLYEGEPICFNLLMGGKIRFEIGNAKVSNVKKFIRTVEFPNIKDEDDISEEDYDEIFENIGEI